MITQIYELQDCAEAETVVSLGVDRIGSVILSGKEWKVPEIRDVGILTKKNKVQHSLIPLFGEEETVLRVIAYYEPHIIHFCESLVSSSGQMVDLAPFISLQKSVKKRFPNVQVMRSVPIPIIEKGFPTLEIAKALEASCDFFLTDTWLGNEPVEGFIGITGKPCAWGMARRLVEASDIPVILAGGLSPENVYDGIITVRPYGVDSCTQTNLRDHKGVPIRFKKDVRRVQQFVREARRAQADLNRMHREDCRL